MSQSPRSPHPHAVLLDGPALAYRADLESPQCVAWCPSDGQLLVGSPYGLLCCERGGASRYMTQSSTPVSVAFREDGRYGVFIDATGEAQVLRRSTSVRSLPVRTGLVERATAFAVRGRCYVFGGDARGAHRLFEIGPAGARPVSRLPAGAFCGPGPRGPRVGRLLMGRLVLTSPEETGLRPSDAGALGLVRQSRTITWTTRAVAVHRGSRDVVTAPITSVTACDLSSDGSVLAAGTLEGDLVLVALDDPDSRRRPTRLSISAGPVRAVRFSPDDAWLATVGDHADIWACGQRVW